MEFSELIKNRFSVRKFKRDKVEREKINVLLAASILSPTAVNYQPQRILIIDSEENLNKLKECTPFHFHAPLVMIVCYDKNVSWKRDIDNKDFGEIDASIVATHIMLQATNIGLGTTWVGEFDVEKLKKAFAFPENIIPVAMLPIGYPREDCKIHPFHFASIDIKDTYFDNSFDKSN